MTIEYAPIDTNHIKLEDYEPIIGTRKIRFQYVGTWTRWFKETENISWLHNLKIDKMEVIEIVKLKKSIVDKSLNEAGY